MKKKEYDKSISDHTEALRLTPNSSTDYHNRGLSRDAKKEYDRAISDYTEAIRISPTFVKAYYHRGNAYFAMGLLDKANDDYTEALRIDPKYVHALFGQGLFHSKSKRYSQANIAFTEAIKLDPKYDEAHNELAWIYATCPDASVRDGKKAVYHAKEACNLTEWKNGSCIDTLAAAYAESGDFDKAIKYERQAMTFADLMKTDGEDLKKRLALYTAGEPYRDSK